MVKAHDLRNQDEIHNRVVNKGLIAAAKWGTCGVLGHFALTSYVPRYAKHTMPFKVFILLMIPTAAFFTVTDVEAMVADREFASQFSVTKKEDLVNESAPTQSIKDYIRENQFSLVAKGYFGLVGLSLAYNFARKEIGFTQKLINTRMVGQAGALVAIASVAALQLKRDKTVPVDRHFERIVYGDQQNTKDPHFNKIVYGEKHQ
jgi:hypothetical protein